MMKKILFVLIIYFPGELFSKSFDKIILGLKSSGVCVKCDYSAIEILNKYKNDSTVSVILVFDDENTKSINRYCSEILKIQDISNIKIENSSAFYKKYALKEDLDIPYISFILNDKKIKSIDISAFFYEPLVSLNNDSFKLLPLNSEMLLGGNYKFFNISDEEIKLFNAKYNEVVIFDFLGNLKKKVNLDFYIEENLNILNAILEKHPKNNLNAQWTIKPKHKISFGKIYEINNEIITTSSVEISYDTLINNVVSDVLFTVPIIIYLDSSYKNITKFVLIDEIENCFFYPNGETLFENDEITSKFYYQNKDSFLRNSYDFYSVKLDFNSHNTSIIEKKYPSPDIFTKFKLFNNQLSPRYRKDLNDSTLYMSYQLFPEFINSKSNRKYHLTGFNSGKIGKQLKSDKLEYQLFDYMVDNGLIKGLYYNSRKKSFFKFFINTSENTSNTFEFSNPEKNNNLKIIGFKIHKNQGHFLMENKEGNLFLYSGKF